MSTHRRAAHADAYTAAPHVRREHAAAPGRAAALPLSDVNWPLLGVAAVAACAAVLLAGRAVPMPAPLAAPVVALRALVGLEAAPARLMPAPLTQVESNHGLPAFAKGYREGAVAGLPAWARVFPVLQWHWHPAMDLANVDLGGGPVRLRATTGSKLASWDPNAVEGARSLFVVRDCSADVSVVRADSGGPGESCAGQIQADRAADARRSRAFAASFAAAPAAARAAHAAGAGALGSTAELAADIQAIRSRFAKAHPKEAAQAAASGRPIQAFLSGEEGLAEVREEERAGLRYQKGAVGVDDVTKADGMPMAKLTYKDGRSEVVPYDPLVFDLHGRGPQTSSRRVLFDLAAAGRADRIQWVDDVDNGTGILVFDPAKSGRPGKNGAEVFGDRTELGGLGSLERFVDGFAALRGLVERAESEGVLPRGAAAGGILNAKALSALEKAYGLRMKVGGFYGRALPLAKAGVAAVALSSRPRERIRDFDGQGNDIVLQPGAQFLRADGTTGQYANLFLGAAKGSSGSGLQGRAVAEVER